MLCKRKSFECIAIQISQPLRDFPEKSKLRLKRKCECEIFLSKVLNMKKIFKSTPDGGRTFGAW